MPVTPAGDHAWRRVAGLAELVEGVLVRREVESSHGRTRPTAVLLALIDGQVHAFEDACPHAGWPLSDGDFDGCLLTCARHFWEFDVAKGNSRAPVGWPLRTFPIQVDGFDDVLVDVYLPLYQR